MAHRHVRLAKLMLSLLSLWVAIQSTACTVAYPSNVTRHLDRPERDPSRPFRENGEGRIRKRRDLADGSLKDASDFTNPERDLRSLDHDAGEPPVHPRGYERKRNRTFRGRKNRNRKCQQDRPRWERKVRLKAISTKHNIHVRSLWTTEPLSCTFWRY